MCSLIGERGEKVKDFDKIYAEYFSEVYKFVFSLCKNTTLAEEITQETFFKALKGIGNFRGECKISVWLCQIAKNTYFSHLNKNRNNTDFPLEITVSDEDIEQQFIDKETALEIHKILHNLKEPYKEVFWLRAFGDLSFSQIGVVFDKTESWARVTYYRAKLMIKENLK